MKIEIGSRVRYSEEYLRSTGQYTGDICFAEGFVADLRIVGHAVQLATVNWNTDGIPRSVYVKNLELCK